MKDFLELVKKGTLNQVQEAIKADLSAQDQGSMIPLMYAAARSIGQTVSPKGNHFHSEEFPKDLFGLE